MTLTVRLTSSLESALDRYSGERGLTKSHVVQEALGEYLAQRAPAATVAREPSANYKAFEKAGLIGRATGDGRSATKEVVRERIRARLARE